MTDAAKLLAFAEKHRLAISPQVNGGWVIEHAHMDLDDGQEYELVRTRGTLLSALTQAQLELEGGEEGGEARDPASQGLAEYWEYQG